MNYLGRYKVGDRATIYCDPMTETRVEGKATLLRCVAEYPDLVSWEVRFDDDHDPKAVFLRLIKK